MNEVIENMIQRRSIRKFKAEQVEEEKLQQILEAGSFAPSGMGKQSPIMVVVQDKETIQQLSQMNAKIMGTPGVDPFYGAPTVVIVLAQKNIPTYKEDGSLVMGNLMNAAWSVGVDSCWIHRAKEEFRSTEGKELLNKWGIQGEVEGIGHCLLGYRNCNVPDAKVRKTNYIYRV